MLYLYIKKCETMIICFGLLATQVIVRKWDQQEERLIKVSEEEVFIRLSFIKYM